MDRGIEDSEVSWGNPRDQAIFAVFQRYMQSQDMAGVPPELASIILPVRFAGYLLDHPEEMAREFK